MPFFSKLIEYKQRKHIDCQFISITNDYFEKNGANYTEIDLVDTDTRSVIDELVLNSSIPREYEEFIKQGSI